MIDIAHSNEEPFNYGEWFHNWKHVDILLSFINSQANISKLIL